MCRWMYFYIPWLFAMVCCMIEWSFLWTANQLYYFAMPVPCSIEQNDIYAVTGKQPPVSWCKW